MSGIGTGGPRTSGGGAVDRWRVELSSVAVTALWALPRQERVRVAARIDQLAASGPPPGPRGEGSTGREAVVELPAGEQVLVCLCDSAARLVVIVTLRSSRAPLRSGGIRLFRRALARFDDSRGGDAMGSFVRDLRFALRSLRRSAGFTTTAVLTLALGIGATAAIFSVANGVLLRSLPYAEPDEVITVWASWADFPDKTWLSVPEYQLFHQENRTLDDLAIYSTGSANFTSVDSPERVGAASVTPNLFALLGAAPVMGRTFTWEEAQEANPGIVIAHETWMRRYGGDRSIVGTDVELDGELTSVLGILPEGFRLPVDFASASPAEVFFPTYVDLESPAPDLGDGGSHGSYAVGRLLEGVTVEGARADFERMMAQVEPVGLYSPERRFSPRVFAAKADIVGGAGSTILVLLGAVGFVLLIACGNVANLLLARSSVRTGEVAVRTALGAGRARILRQLMTESVLLALAGGALGLGLALAGVEGLLSVNPDAVPRSAGVGLDATVVLFTLGVSLATAAVFGVVPALRVARSGVGVTLHDTGRGNERGARSNRLQRLLVATQLAMAVILLTASGLMMRSFVSLLRIDPGFHAENVLTLRVTAAQGRYPDGEAVARFYDEMLRRVRELPGVRDAAAVRLLPLASTMGDAPFRPVGYEPGPNEATQGDWQWVTPGYFEIMGIPLVEGRPFDERDARDAQQVVVVNQAIARRYWGSESALGREVTAGGGAPAVVVGVVGNLRHNGLTGEAKTRFYRPHAQIGTEGFEGWQGTMRSMTLTVATEGDSHALSEPVRGAIRALDPSMPVSEVRTMDEVLSTAVAQPRFAMVLLGAFATLALALAVVGIYGVLAYAVSQRTREIGIRMALGAESGRMVGMVVREGMLMALAGVFVGTGMAWFMTGLMSSLLHGVAPRDPGTFAAVPVLFVLVALLACWLPASRAARVRPANALRY